MRIYKKRDILDCAVLDKALTQHQSGTQGVISEKSRQALLDILRQTLKSGRNRLHQYHLDGASGQFIVQGHAYLMDMLLQRIFQLIQNGHIQNISQNIDLRTLLVI